MQDFKNFLNSIENLDGEPRRSYFPWYDDLADYNTNAKSYYDYLARFNRIIKLITRYVNRLLDRDLKTLDTESVNLTKGGSWQSDQPPYDDITLSADVRVSSAKVVGTVGENTYRYPNAIGVLSDGLYATDYKPQLDEVTIKVDELSKLAPDTSGYADSEQVNAAINILQDQITTLQNLLEDYADVKANAAIAYQSIHKIVTNLAQSGAVDSYDLIDFNFIPGRHIASGNINLFGHQPDGTFFIRTSNTKSAYDIALGIDS